MSEVIGLSNNSYKPITNTAWVRVSIVNYKKDAFDSQPQVIKLTSCLAMVGGSLRVLRFLPPLKLVAMIYSWNIAESGVKHNQNQNKLEKKYAPALDNYGQSCFIRSDFLKMKCDCKTQMMPPPDYRKL
jgi:hypothetical protein